jgi:hypothetical protein
VLSFCAWQVTDLPHVACSLEGNNLKRLRKAVWDELEGGILSKSHAQGWSYKNRVALKLEYALADQGFSLMAAVGEIKGD